MRRLHSRLRAEMRLKKSIAERKATVMAKSRELGGTTLKVFLY